MLKRLLLLLPLVLALALAGCGGAAEDHSDHEEHSDETHAHEIDESEPKVTIPNDGAVIRIVSPADGSVFKATDEILVEVEVENWDLGVDGKHWHIVLNDYSEIMVMGGNTDQALRNLSPGEHTLKVVMSDGDHADLEDGDTITIAIEE